MDKKALYSASMGKDGNGFTVICKSVVIQNGEL